MAQNNALNDLSFEQALTELETIVRGLETGESPLEDSINAYERGMALKKHCETKLSEARMKIEKITLDKDRNAKTESLDAE